MFALVNLQKFRKISNLEEHITDTIMNY